MTFESVTFDVRAMIESVIRAMEPVVAAKPGPKLKLLCSISPTLPSHLVGGMRDFVPLHPACSSGADHVMGGAAPQIRRAFGR
jgi:hypothetical protein